MGDFYLKEKYIKDDSKNILRCPCMFTVFGIEQLISDGRQITLNNILEYYGTKNKWSDNAIYAEVKRLEFLQSIKVINIGCKICDIPNLDLNTELFGLDGYNSPFTSCPDKNSVCIPEHSVAKIFNATSRPDVLFNIYLCVIQAKNGVKIAHVRQMTGSVFKTIKSSLNILIKLKLVRYDDPIYHIYSETAPKINTLKNAVPENDVKNKGTKVPSKAKTFNKKKYNKKNKAENKKSTTAEQASKASYVFTENGTIKIDNVVFTEEALRKMYDELPDEESRVRFMNSLKLKGDKLEEYEREQGIKAMNAIRQARIDRTNAIISERFKK